MSGTDMAWGLALPQNQRRIPSSLWLFSLRLLLEMISLGRSRPI